MRATRVLLSTLVLALTIFGGRTVVHAADSDRSVAALSKDWIRAGEEVVLTFSLDETAEREDGLNALEATLVYDRNVLAPVQAEDFSTCEDWEGLQYNPENGKIVVINRAGDRDGGEVFQLRLKANTDLSPKESVVRLTDLAVSEGREDAQLEDASAVLQVVVEAANPGGSGEQNGGTNNPSQGGNSSNGAAQNSGNGSTGAEQNGSNSSNGATQNAGGNSGSTVSNGNNGSTGTANGTTQNGGNNGTAGTTQSGVSSSSRPAQSGSSESTSAPQSESAEPAGEAQDTTATSEPAQQEQTDVDRVVEKNSKAIPLFAALFLLFCLILVILATRRGWLSKKAGRALAVILAAAFIAVLIGGIAYAMPKKGDLNGDGRIDYTDVELLAKHMTRLELLDEDKRVNADLDSNNRLTIKDLALLIRMVEKTVHYEVELFSVLQEPYQEKNQQMTLEFQAQVSYDARITEVTVNDQVYPVQQAEDGATYAITVSTGETAGLLPFHFTQVTLVGGQTVEVDYTETLDVLKDVPSVQSFTTEELTDTVQLKAKFFVQDDDQALTSAVMELVQNTESGFDVLMSEEVTAGWNEFVLDLAEGQEAALSVCLSYDRTTGELDADGQAYVGTVNTQWEMLFPYEYDFSFSDLQTRNEAMEETSVFGKNEPVVLQFSSTNRSQFAPERVVVNGTEYPVTAIEEENRYQVVLPGRTVSGEQRILVDQVILSNGKLFQMDENAAVTITVEKTRPTLDKLEVREEQAGKTLQVSLAISDPDGALSNRKLVVKDEQGTVLQQMDFAENSFDGAVELSNVFAGAYTVEVLADCDISFDGSGAQPGLILGTNTIQALPRVEVTGMNADKTWYEKGEPMALTVQLQSNRAAAVEKLTVNNVSYPAQQLENGGYQITVPAPGSAGEQQLKLSLVSFADKTDLSVQAQMVVHVLRQVPVVENYQAEDDFDNDQVVFNFIVSDPDGALMYADAVLTAEDGSIQAQERMDTAGEHTLRFPVVEGQPYTFTLTLTSDRGAADQQPVEEVVLTRPIQMIRDYQLTVSELTATGPYGAATPYFEKGQSIGITFASSNQTRFVPVALVSGEVEYTLTDSGNGQYTATLPGTDKAGIVQFAADGLRMNNGKLLEIENGRQVRYEILKDAPAVTGFTFGKTDQDELQVQFELTDPDDALESARVKITDELGALVLDEPVQKGSNLKKAALTAGEQYTVEVTATYDRDTNTLDDQSNRYSDVSLLHQQVEASREGILLKDVVSNTLYLSGDNGTQQVEMLDITQGLPDPSGYYALVQMENLPDFYAAVREFRVDGTSQQLEVVLDQENLIYYDTSGTKHNAYSFPISYQDGDGNHALMQSAEELFRQMASNLNGKFELTCDLDASGIAASGYAIPGTFTGTLNGNGHTIYNLPTGLFQKLSGANVSNLVLEDARITGNQNGILAGSIENRSAIDAVFLVDCSIWNSSNMTGGFTGRLANSTIQQSAAVNLTIKADNTIGGIAGQTDPGSKVEDCYVTGQLQGTRSHNLGARVGGISGWHSGAMIQRCLTKVNIIAPANNGNGGIIGGPNAATSSKISQCVSLGGGNAYRIAGFTAALSSAENVYEYAGSSSPTNRTDGNSDRIHEVSELSRSFYADTLGMSSTVWYLDLVDSGRLPSLKADPLPKDPAEYEILENALGIPNYRQLRSQKDYRAEREMAYANLARLLPFADTAEWVAYGNSLPEGSTLLHRSIQYILPLNENGGLVSGLDVQNPAAVQTVRLVYTDGTAQDVPVSYSKLLGGLVAVYRMDGTALGAGELKYQFRGYAKDLSQLDLAGLVQTASALDYDADIASLTSETEGRLYRDHYQESVQPELEAVIRNLLLSQEEFPAYTSSVAVQNLMRQRLDQQSLVKTLYAYNYYHKWYDIHFNGVNLSDLLFFSGDLLNSGFSSNHLTEMLLTAASDLRGTGRTYDFYTQILKPYTGMEMMDFLAKLAKGAGFEDPSDWFAAEFDGILVEQKADTQREGIQYRVWDILNTLGGRRQIILPILSAPQQDMYILTVPSQLIIGSMNRYGQYQVKDGGERDRMRALIEAYAQRYAHFYGVSANWITNAPQILNGFVNIQYDTRFNFPATAVTNEGEQVKGVTQDPTIKWVYEAVGAYSTMGGVGAYANGTDVYCVAYPAIGTDFTFYALTHETAHNQDGRYFYAGYGRRGGTGPESHADGNIAQQIEDGSMVFNISRICDPGSDVTNNLSYHRIETADQVWDYYSKMFETSYVIDYLAGQAFLQLEPEEQARVAIQVSHVQQGNSVRSIYRKLTADDFRAMDLQNMADLWDNRIALKAEGDRAPAGGTGAYGYESFYDVNWYQPHFDEGSPDSSSFKRLGQEMLGVGGYENGYVTYISGKSSNDLQALRTITGDPDITWRSYKLGRYDAVAQKLGEIPYFDAQSVIEQFKQAFRQDNKDRNQSVALQRTLYGIIKRATGDFVTGTVYAEQAPISITSAAQLIQAVQENPMGYYRLEADLDFTGIPATDGAYIATRFIGMLDGNGHRLTGVSQTLFKEMVYGQIMNLTVDAPTYSEQAGAYLALSTKNVVIRDVAVEGADLNLPIVKQKTGGYYEFGTVSATIGQRTISTVEEFLAIGSSATDRKKDYVLGGDLDFAGVELGNSAVSGTFSGKLDGNGYSIRNLSAPLFESVNGAQIRNLTLQDGSLSKDVHKGLLSNTMDNSTLENVRVSNSTIINNSNQVGMLSGIIRKSNLSRISLAGIQVSANNTVGGVAGEIDGTTLENCIVTGSVQGKLDNHLGSRAGGITGWLQTNSNLNNCYVNAVIGGAKTNGNGGLIGGPNSGNVTIRNAVSLSTGTNAYRISGFPVLNAVENLYELESSDSLTNQTEGNAGRVNLVTAEQAQDPNFYTQQLGWSEDIWDFGALTEGGTPALR